MGRARDDGGLDDDQVIPEAPVALANQSESERIFVNQMIRSGADLDSSHYYLQLLSTDEAAGKKPLQTVQWIDFEIVKRFGFNR